MTGPDQPLAVRRAAPEDPAACRAIYAPYVEDTAISLEAEPPSVTQMRGRIGSSLATHDWLVLEELAGGTEPPASWPDRERATAQARSRRGRSMWTSQTGTSTGS